jgi:hypothetical protein
MVQRFMRQPAWSIGTLVRAHLVMFGGGFVVLGLSQVLQPERWEPRPSFGLIYQLLPVVAWGWIFLLVGILKLVAASVYPRFALAAITIGSALVAAWAVSFTLRYFSDANTPPHNAVVWVWLVVAHVGVSTMLAPRHDRPARG